MAEKTSLKLKSARHFLSPRRGERIKVRGESFKHMDSPPHPYPLPKKDWGEGNLRGAFITFEGPEGCGKTTHARLAVEYLKSMGKDVIWTREPGGTKVGEKIRTVLLDQHNKGVSVSTEAFLYLAARAQLVNEVILPALKKGKIVICDRFQDATVAYQGYAGGLDINILDRLGDIATGGLKPGLTILLDIDTKLGLSRAGCKDRMEKKSVAFHKKVRRGYLALAKKEQDRIKVVRVRGSIEETEKEIKGIILKTCLLGK